MKSNKEFTDAFEQFKAVDAEVQRLTQRIEQSKAERVKAALEAAAADTEVTKFVTSAPDSIAADEAAARKQRADSVVDLLDQQIREGVAILADVCRHEFGVPRRIANVEKRA